MVGFAPIFGGFGSGGTPGGGGGGADPDHWDDVVLQTHFSDLAMDESEYGHILEYLNGAAISGGELVLDGTNDYAGWNGDGTGIQLGGDDFTIELFGVVFDTVEDCTVAGQEEADPGTGGRAWNIYRRSGGWTVIASADGSADFLGMSVSDSLSVGTSYDVTLERSGNTWRLYRDGAMLTSVTASETVFSTIEPLRLGARNNAGVKDDFMHGRFAAIRVTIGTARYASDSGYTVPTLPLDAGAVGLAGQRAAPGAWTWFNDPRAILYDTGSKLAFTAIQRQGELDIFEAASPFTDFARTRLSADNGVDDHNNAGLLVRESDSKIMAWYTGHAGSTTATYYNQQISSAANDASAFGAATDLDASLGDDFYTYANPVQLTGETNDPIYLFYRQGDGTDRKWKYSKSTDDGANWATGTVLLDTSLSTYSPYLRWVRTSSTRIDFVCTDGHPNDVATSVYHFYYEGGTFQEIGGAALTLPIDPATDLTAIYDGSTVRAWIWEIQIDGSGNPVIAYTRLNSASDHEYWRLSYNGTSWDDEKIADAGGTVHSNSSTEPYYSGGVCLDPASTDVAYCSIEDGAGVHQLWKYTRGGGGTWSGTQLTTNIRPSFRPFVVPSAGKLLYLNGKYDTSQDYHTTVCIADAA